jgi:hypothetical protein
LTSFEHFRQLNGSSRVFAFFDSHLMPSGTFSATLTTRAFDPSRLRWFATCSCKPIARGQFVLVIYFSHLLRRLLRHTDVSSHHNVALLTWVIIQADGKEFARGGDQITVDRNGQISKITTFAPSVKDPN